MADHLQRFLFKDLPLRGAIVRLEQSWQTILKQREYPKNLSELLAEILCANLLISSTIKWQGRIIIQYQGEGPLSLLVAKSNHLREISATAKWDDPLPESPNLIIPAGQLVVTILQDHQVQPYQSIIPINTKGITNSLQDYFKQSEQLPSYFWLAGTPSDCFGMVLQCMPDTANTFNFDDFISNASNHPINFSTDNESLLKDCFNEHNIQLFDEEAVTFKCQCSHEKMEQAIKTLGKEDAYATFSTDKELVVSCDFCNTSFAFSKEDIDTLFKQEK